MQQSILTITHQNTTYEVVMDSVYKEKGRDDALLFIAHEVTIGDIDHYFYNDLSQTETDNNIGFWHTILTNFEFDYSTKFNYKFVVDDKEYVVTFVPGKGVSAYQNIGAVNDVDAQLIEINFNDFNKFVPIQTQAQKQNKRKQKIQRIALKHLALYVFLGIGLSGYYFYSKAIFNEKEIQLNELKNQNSKVVQQINQTYANQININTAIGTKHIKRVFALEANGINIQNSNIQMDSDTVLITIGFDDVEKALRVANNNNFNVKVSRDFEKNQATISWQVD